MKSVIGTFGIILLGLAVGACGDDSTEPGASAADSGTQTPPEPATLQEAMAAMDAMNQHLSSMHDGYCTCSSDKSSSYCQSSPSSCYPSKGDCLAAFSTSVPNDAERACLQDVISQDPTKAKAYFDCWTEVATTFAACVQQGDCDSAATQSCFEAYKDCSFPPEWKEPFDACHGIT
jgi:hypothetical protein